MQAGPMNRICFLAAAHICFAPGGGHLVKLMLIDIPVFDPPAKKSYHLVRPEVQHGPRERLTLVAPGEVLLQRTASWGIHSSVLFDTGLLFGGGRPLLTHQRFRRDFPFPGDAGYAVYNEGDDPEEGILMCCTQGDDRNVHLVKVFHVPDENFWSWSQIHFQLLLESAQRAAQLILNGPGLKELRAIDEQLYLVLTIQSCKRGLPLFPVVHDQMAPTVCIAAGVPMGLHRWRRFSPDEVGSEKFRLAQYLRIFLANLGESIEVFEVMDGRPLVPYQCAVTRSAYARLRERFIGCFLLQKTAYRRANGGSTAPSLHEDVEPRFLRNQMCPEAPSFAPARTRTGHRVVVRRTFLEVPVDPHSQSDADDSDEDVLVHVRSRRRPKTTTVLPESQPMVV
ncbi:unnamed protein product [Durusdinium trenchii]|uniref:Uncharacterized protein n=1 Tax=Durusdinium trenchii TaxID=1381693 RepID=A0ABP0QY47_9DINO